MHVNVGGDNNVNAYDANVLIGGNNFTDAVILENNTCSGAKYGIETRRPDSALIDCRGHHAVRQRRPGFR